MIKVKQDNSILKIFREDELLITLRTSSEKAFNLFNQIEKLLEICEIEKITEEKQIRMISILIE